MRRIAFMRGFHFAGLVLALFFLFGVRPHEPTLYQGAVAACADPCDCTEDGSVEKALAEANAAKQTNKMIAAQTAFNQSIANAATSTAKNLLGDINTKYCLDSFFSDAIGQIASAVGASSIVSAILSVVSTLMDGSCAVSISFKSNVLSSICIPTPSSLFSLSGLSLDIDLTGEYCNGTSLSSISYLNSTPTSNSLWPEILSWTELGATTPTTNPYMMSEDEAYDP